MQVCVATGKDHLNKLVKENIHGQVVLTYNTLEELQQNQHLYDMLVVSTGLYGKILDFIYGLEMPIILLTEGESVSNIQIHTNIKVIDTEGMWDEQVCDLILDEVNTDEVARLSVTKLKSNGKSKIVVVYSPAPREGKTTIMSNLVVDMASLAKDKQIVAVCLNFKQSDLLFHMGFREPQEINSMATQSLESMLPILTSTTISQDMLSSKVYFHKKYKNLHIMPQLLNRYYAHHITDNHIINLLKTLQELYDYVVVEVGSYMDNSATLISMISADQVMVVTTYDTTSYDKSWNTWMAPGIFRQLGLEKEKFHLIVNEREACTYLTPQKIAKFMDIELIGSIPPLGKVTKDALVEDKSLFDLLETKEIKEFKDTIHAVTKQITGLEHVIKEPGFIRSFINNISVNPDKQKSGGNILAKLFRRKKT